MSFAIEDCSVFYFVCQRQSWFLCLCWVVFTCLFEGSANSAYRIRFAEFRCVTAPHVFQHDSQSREILNCFGDLSGSLLRIVLSGSLLRKFLDNFLTLQRRLFVSIYPGFGRANFSLRVERNFGLSLSPRAKFWAATFASNKNFGEQPFALSEVSGSSLRLARSFGQQLSP